MIKVQPILLLHPLAGQGGGKEPDKQAGGVGARGESLLLLKQLSPRAFPQARAVSAASVLGEFLVFLADKKVLHKFSLSCVH